MLPGSSLIVAAATLLAAQQPAQAIRVDLTPNPARP
jgi:hypothetical protein